MSRLSAELLITAGVEGLPHLDALIQRIEDAGGTLTLGNAPEHWLQQAPAAGVGDGCRIRISMDEKTDEIMG